MEGWRHYCAAKTAVLSLTRVADKEHLGPGVWLIGPTPGTGATEMQVQITAPGISPVSQADPRAYTPQEWGARAIAWLEGPEADALQGTEFLLTADAGRAAGGPISGRVLHRAR